MNTSNDAIIMERSDGALTIRVPMKIKRRGGRKEIVLPEGYRHEATQDSKEPTPLQYALARGYRWLAMLESGEADSIKAIAKKVGVDSSYVSRMINLTTLAPDIVTAILDNDLPDNLILFSMAVDPPRVWEEQREKFGFRD